MIRRLLYRITANMPCRLISRDGTQRYLERYYVGQALGITAYLHRFVAEDADKEVHDHPFRAIAVCLAGSYWEERAVLCSRDGWRSRQRRIRPGRLNVIGLHTFHRIQKTQPETWTLFVHGPRHKGWGFLRAIDSDEQPQKHDVIYNQSFALTSSAWWNNAPRGREADRAPMQATVKGG